MSTAARITNGKSARFYLRDGTPFFEVPYKDPTKGSRPATLADARKVGALPSVTSLLRLLDKPELNAWIQEQACLAVLTTPRKDGEGLDDFVHRVLHVERVQDEQAAKARQLGSDIHEALQLALTDQPWPQKLAAYVRPVLKWRMEVGKVVWTEKVLVGDGYAGRADALLDNESLNVLSLVDFKSCAKLPKESWPEHKIQTAAYAATLTGKRVLTTNVYISTANPGQFAVYSQSDWAETYVNVFEHLVKLWKGLNHY